MFRAFNVIVYLKNSNIIKISRSDNFHLFLIEIQRIISKKTNITLTATSQNLDESSKHMGLKNKEPIKETLSQTKKSLSIQDLQNSSQKSNKLTNLQVKLKIKRLN